MTNTENAGRAARPTQVDAPWTASLRTGLQALVGAVITLGLLVPEVIEIVLDEAGQSMPETLRGWLLAAAAATAGVAAVVTRVMALPRVEAWLGRRAPVVSAQGRKR